MSLFSYPSPLCMSHGLTNNQLKWQSTDNMAKKKKKDRITAMTIATNGHLVAIHSLWNEA